MLRFHWGGQVSADIQAQSQILFDAMTPEQQQQVLTAQAARDAEFARLKQQRVEKFRASRFGRWWRSGPFHR